jgi:hypothetical protein
MLAAQIRGIICVIREHVYFLFCLFDFSAWHCLTEPAALAGDATPPAR